MPQSHLARVLLALRANHEWETIVLPKSRLDPLVAVLPLGLRPSQPDQLERIGSFKDGGYLIDPRDIARADGLISLGIDRDWSFERQFRRRNPVPVHAYDGCTDTGYLLSDFARGLRDLNWRWAVRSILRTMDYWWFFSGPSVRHYRRFVGTDQFAYEKTAATTIPLQQVFDGIRDAGSLKPFVKIDIEGAEYLMLDELIERGHDTAGLAIEFHDCDTRMTEIGAFVERYSLPLVHVHANPYGGIGDGGIPRALELTFSSSGERRAAPPTLPHPLDRPNDGSVDIILQFA